MGKPILPETIREDIKELLRKGYTREAVAKFVKNEAQDYVDSDEQLNRCIVSIERTINDIPEHRIGLPVPPKSKIFDPKKYSRRLTTITKRSSIKKIDEIGVEVAKKLLTQELGFTKVQDGPKFAGTPFDLLGFLNPDLASMRD